MTPLALPSIWGLVWGVAVVCVLGMDAGAGAFSAGVDVAGPLAIVIADPGAVAALGRPMRVDVTVRNTGLAQLNGAVRLGVIDDWVVVDPPTLPLSIEAGASRTIPFHVIPGIKSFAALYPIHAFADFRMGQQDFGAHAVLVVAVLSTAVADAKPLAGRLPTLTLLKDGKLPLDVAGLFQPSIAIAGKNDVAMPIGWQGTDALTGAYVHLEDANRGDLQHSLSVHPAWRGGWGDVFVDCKIALPTQTPIRLSFSTAIRDNRPSEPPSDGVRFSVQVGDVREKVGDAGEKVGDAGRQAGDTGQWKTLFDRFSASKRWENASVDLSAYAGKTITLRLITDPGPAHDTTCDQSFWGSPMLIAGASPTAPAKADRDARSQRAIANAQSAFHGDAPNWSWHLESAAGVTGVAIVPGPSGLADAFIAFADERRNVVFDGFIVEVDDRRIGDRTTDVACERVENQFDSGRGTITMHVNQDGNALPLQAVAWAENGALRISFSMPGVVRNPRGEPRFTSLCIGPASELAHRVYAGFGNVIQDPGAFDLPAGGFALSTRHVGMDFANGLSLVQASDIFPDNFRVDPAHRDYALVVHHDATLSFVPSTRQAFAAARVYHDLANFQTAGGVATLQGRVCFDQWGGDYAAAAADVESAARYGLTDALLVKHIWQRWGYDYRLPDIYPPNGDQKSFLEMVNACKRNGILFAPHDNYIDFYPDASGFSYDPILFNADGTPQEAWLNKGRAAQSYRWSPNSFAPRLEANLAAIKAGFSPTAYFVDVFSAIAPMDFYDRQGRFFSKSVTTARWGAAFDRIREILGNSAPTISEAGADGLIGHLDGGESDHSGWEPESTDPRAFCWKMPAADAERIPWHDVASHGSFVLLAGGLGSRYAGGQDEVLHGYGSDDYLSLTVLGGRSPMCDGPFSRRAVMTYWLLHDVCDSLAHRQLLSDEFSEDDIHRQTVHFSADTVVQVNRGKTDWIVGDQTLPKYGFIARAGDSEAGITRRGGVISAFAKSPGVYFVDARPAVSDHEGAVTATVAGVDDLGHRRFRLRINWTVEHPVARGFVPFVHFVDDKIDGDGIMFQGSVDLDPAKLAVPGTYPSSGDITIPDDVKSPSDFAIRFGLYESAGDGKRLPMLGASDAEGRARGGTLHLENSAITWRSEPADPTSAARSARLNVGNAPVDFGFAVTDGAFRLMTKASEWQVIPLPNSPAFSVGLRLNQLNAGGKRVRDVVEIGRDGAAGKAVEFRDADGVLRFDARAGAFGYRVRFGE